MLDTRTLRAALCVAGLAVVVEVPIPANRGIDSFKTTDLIQYVDRLVIRYSPRMVVRHVGGNDINGGRTPEQVLADTKTLVSKIRAGLPRVRLTKPLLGPPDRK